MLGETTEVHRGGVLRFNPGLQLTANLHGLYDSLSNIKTEPKNRVIGQNFVGVFVSVKLVLRVFYRMPSGGTCIHKTQYY